MGLVAAALSCLAVLVAARTAPAADRSRVLPCAVLFAAGWLAYIASWIPHSPHLLLNSPAQIIWRLTGAVVRPEHLWAGADAIIGFFCFTKASDKFWGISLFLLFVDQIAIHLAYERGSFSQDAYASMLDATFYLEVMCLLIGGAGGRVRDWIDSFDGAGIGSVDPVRHTRRAAEANEMILTSRDICD